MQARDERETALLNYFRDASPKDQDFVLAFAAASAAHARIAIPAPSVLSFKVN